MPNPSTAARLLLASASPRRRELLRAAGVAHECRAAAIAEEPRSGEGPAAFARRLAREKAEAVAGGAEATSARWVLGADTIVVLDGEIFGKPRDARDAIAMLERLAGRRHRVLTAVCLLGPGEERGRRLREFAVESRVELRRAPREVFEAYVASGEPLDKAGSYALQGEGARFVARVEGSRSNVIGLPLDETLADLRGLGLATQGTRSPDEIVAALCAVPGGR